MAKRTPKKPTAVVPKKANNSGAFGIGGGTGTSLEGALFGQGWTPWTNTTELSQVQTLYNNCRWYLLSNERQILCELYVEHGLIQTIVDLPVDDGFRGGISIKTEQLDEKEIKKLKTEMQRQGDIRAVMQALKWNRLFGGAGLVIVTDQPGQEPLNIDAIKKGSPLEFRACDMWELFWNAQNAQGYDIETQTQNFEFYDYYSRKLHKSRVMAMKGLEAPSFIRPRLRGWGFSVIEAMVRSINQYLKQTDLAFEVLDEFKLDVYKIKGLASMLLGGPDAEAAVRRRIAIANRQKNYQNALTMDSEDDYDHKQLSFSGLAETMKEIRMQVACDLRMPITKLFGVSASGFNSGEDDIENYNSMIESQVREKAIFDLLRVIELRAKNLFGFAPDDVEIEFAPLRVLSAEQEENVKTQKFNRVTVAFDKGLMSAKEFKEACNKDNLLPVALDPSVDVLDTGNPDDSVEEEAPEGDKAGTSKLAAKAPKEAKS